MPNAIHLGIPYIIKWIGRSTIQSIPSSSTVNKMVTKVANSVNVVTICFYLLVVV